MCSWECGAGLEVPYTARNLIEDCGACTCVCALAAVHGAAMACAGRASKAVCATQAAVQLHWTAAAARLQPRVKQHQGMLPGLLLCMYLHRVVDDPGIQYWIQWNCENTMVVCRPSGPRDDSMLSVATSTM